MIALPPAGEAVNKTTRIMLLIVLIFGLAATVYWLEQPLRRRPRLRLPGARPEPAGRAGAGGVSQCAEHADRHQTRAVEAGRQGQ
jgi:hypothetical protein